jgi:hypothetical protein
MSSGTRKMIGILLITFMSVIQLVLLFMMIYDLLDSKSNGVKRGVLDTVFTMAVFAFPLYLGIRMYREGSNGIDAKSASLPADGRKEIQITTTITYPEYRNLTFRILYTNPAIIFLNVAAIFLIVVGCVEPGYLHFSMMGLTFLIGIPLLLLRQTKKNYAANKAVTGTFTYTADVDKIVISSGNDSATIVWSSLYKVNEMEDWFLLYVDRNIAHFIPKRAFHDENETMLFRSFVMRNKGNGNIQ